jgi:cystathionine beta-synthase
MRKYKISQIPVIDITGFVGSLDESDLFQSYVNDKNTADKPIKSNWQTISMLKKGTSIEEVSKLFTREILRYYLI